MTKKQFSWLHLSDLHIGQQSQWLWPNLKAIFLEDLHSLSIEAGPIDLVLFSGDLTQRGEKNQYNLLTRELQTIWEMWDKIGQCPYLFTVPGNHDLERPSAKDARLKMLTRWNSEPEVAHEFWEEKDNQYLELVRSAFVNYMAWQEEISDQGIPLAPLTKGLLPGDASSSLVLNGVSVGLIGLNSAFLQLNESDFNEKLILDTRQLNAITEDDASGWCDKHDVNFLITHHPTSWLSVDALREFQAEIYPSGRFTAHLFGHMHDADLLVQYRGGDSGRRSFQSSSLFGMEFLKDGTTERVHGYSVGQISFQEDEVIWKLWPRKATVSRKNGNRKIIPDNDNFDLDKGHECQSEHLVKHTPSSKSIVSASPRNLDLAVAVEENVPQWNNALHSTLYPLAEQEQHLAIRPLQQQACIESIRQKKMVWICTDWRLGRDGFLWSVIKRIKRDNQPVYRVSLGNYSSRDEFLTHFSTAAGCSFPEYCKALAAAGPATLLFDEAPVSVGDYTGLAIERDVEILASMIRDFCPDIVILLLARTIPRDRKIDAVPLEPLDEADTRTYLMAHPGASHDSRSPYAVSEIYRHTDGLPGKIDSTLKTLRVVSLSELGLATSIGQIAVVPAHESIPMSLVRAVTELAESKDSSSKRSYFLLKVLAILPHGESLQRLKRIDPRHPIFPDHAGELLDRDLIQVRSSTTLIGVHGTDEDRIKILVAPRPVRDYMLSRMPEREIDSLVLKAISLYFGENWRTGNASLKRLGGTLISDDGSLLENPHTLVLHLLEHLSTGRAATTASAILNLCHIYCSALLTGDHYRNCIAVCRDILSILPDAGFESHRNDIEVLLARALRMAGESQEARSLFERLLTLMWPKDMKVQIQLGYALCLQSLDDPQAKAAANEVIELAPKTGSALQAHSIILEMEEDADNSRELLKLETEARKRGFNTVANNLALGRISEDEDIIDSYAILREVYATAVNAGDPYNAARAAVKLGAISFKETGSLSRGDLCNLISAYQYFYGERFSSLFLSAHKTLWNFFESQGEVRNLLSLFRHSSFIWRLNGKEKNEQIYVQRLINRARHILTADILTVDKNTAYFLIRARNGKSEPDI